MPNHWSIERQVSEWGEGIQAGQESQLSYLAEPVLPNSRFQDISAFSVSFWWGEDDSQSGRRERNQLCTLTGEQFIQRRLWHVPPPNLQSVRSYGLYASAKQAECDQLRVMLPDVPHPEAEANARIGKEKQEDDRIPLNEYMQQRSHCPVCGKKLELSQIIPSSVTGKISPRDRALARKVSRVKRRRRGS